MLLKFSHFFLLFIPLHPAPIPTSIPPLQFMSIGHTYKFFGFYISHTTLNLPICFVPTNYASYSLCLSPYFPASPSSLITLHVISISVILFLFWFAYFVFVFVFVFQVHLLIVVSVILLFIFFIIFFLDKSL